MSVNKSYYELIYLNKLSRAWQWNAFNFQFEKMRYIVHANRTTTKRSKNKKNTFQKAMQWENEKKSNRKVSNKKCFYTCFDGGRLHTTDGKWVIEISFKNLVLFLFLHRVQKKSGSRGDKIGAKLLLFDNLNAGKHVEWKLRIMQTLYRSTFTKKRC